MDKMNVAIITLDDECCGIENATHENMFKPEYGGQYFGCGSTRNAISNYCWYGCPTRLRGISGTSGWGCGYGNLQFSYYDESGSWITHRGVHHYA